MYVCVFLPLMLRVGKAKGKGRERGMAKGKAGKGVDPFTNKN